MRVLLGKVGSFSTTGGSRAYTSLKHAHGRASSWPWIMQTGIRNSWHRTRAVNRREPQRIFEPGGLADWVASETPIKRWMTKKK